jgi:hypothetical protein
MSKKIVYALVALILAAMACSLPGGAAEPQGAGAVLTAAAETVQAALSQTPESPAAGQSTSEPTTSGGDTAAPAPTTEVATTAPPPPPDAPTATLTSLPCNQASFVSDVTVPDGKKFLPGDSFTKTWRFRNVGSCTWTSGYQLVFDHGDAMNGPASQALTSGTVAPGQTVDVSVNLVAPASEGDYQGFWRFREPGGVLFGLSTGSFWVKIKVVNPTPTSTLMSFAPLAPIPAFIFHTVDVPIIVGQSGAALSDGSTLSPPNVGDTSTNAIAQAFVSFDMSAIPAGSTISSVKVDFSNYDTLGNPFGGLGCLRLYQQDYGSVNAGDYFSGTPLGALVRWCNAGELSAVAVDDDLKAPVQGKVGSSRIQFRLQFKDTPTDHDGVADMVRIGHNVKLIVTYTH